MKRGTEEAAEGIGAQLITDKTVGDNRVLGEGSFGEFVLGGLAGGTVSAVTATKQSGVGSDTFNAAKTGVKVAADLTGQAVSAATQGVPDATGTTERDRKAGIKTIIDIAVNGDTSDLVSPEGIRSYDPENVAELLENRIKGYNPDGSNATDAEVDKARNDLRVLESNVADYEKDVNERISRTPVEDKTAYDAQIAQTQALVESLQEQLADQNTDENTKAGIQAIMGQAQGELDTLKEQRADIDNGKAGRRRSQQEAQAATLPQTLEKIRNINAEFDAFDAQNGAGVSEDLAAQISSPDVEQSARTAAVDQLTEQAINGNQSAIQAVNKLSSEGASNGNIDQNSLDKLSGITEANEIADQKAAIADIKDAQERNTFDQAALDTVSDAESFQRDVAREIKIGNLDKASDNLSKIDAAINDKKEQITQVQEAVKLARANPDGEYIVAKDSNGYTVARNNVRGAGAERITPEQAKEAGHLLIDGNSALEPGALFESLQSDLDLLDLTRDNLTGLYNRKNAGIQSPDADANSDNDFLKGVEALRKRNKQLILNSPSLRNQLRSKKINDLLGISPTETPAETPAETPPPSTDPEVEEETDEDIEVTDQYLETLSQVDLYKLGNETMIEAADADLSPQARADAQALLRRIVVKAFSDPTDQPVVQMMDLIMDQGLNKEAKFKAMVRWAKKNGNPLVSKIMEGMVDVKGSVTPTFGLEVGDRLSGNAGRHGVFITDQGQIGVNPFGRGPTDVANGANTNKEHMSTTLAHEMIHSVADHLIDQDASFRVELMKIAKTIQDHIKDSNDLTSEQLSKLAYALQDFNQPNTGLQSDNLTNRLTADSKLYELMPTIFANKDLAARMASVTHKTGNGTRQKRSDVITKYIDMIETFLNKITGRVDKTASVFTELAILFEQAVVSEKIPSARNTPATNTNSETPAQREAREAAEAAEEARARREAAAEEEVEPVVERMTREQAAKHVLTSGRFAEQRIEDIPKSEVNAALQHAYHALSWYQRDPDDDITLEPAEALNTLQQAMQDVQSMADYFYADAADAAMNDIISMLNTRNGAPAIDVARWAEQNSNTDDIKEFMQSILKTDSVKNAKNITFVGGSPDTDTGVLGYWSVDSDTISLFPKNLKANSAESLQDVVTTVAHEMLHPIGQRQIVLDPEFADEIGRLSDLVQTWKDANPDKYANLSPAVKHYIDYSAQTYLASLNRGQVHHEFLTSVITNIEFRKFLDSLPDTNGPAKYSLLESFKAAFKAALDKITGRKGVSDSVLDSSLSLINEAIQRNIGSPPITPQQTTARSTATEPQAASPVDNQVNPEPTPDVDPNSYTSADQATPEQQAEEDLLWSNPIIDDESDYNEDLAKDRAKRTRELRNDKGRGFFDFENNGQDTPAGVLDPEKLANGDVNWVSHAFKSNNKTPLSSVENFMQEVLFKIADSEEAQNELATHMGDKGKAALDTYLSKGNVYDLMWIMERYYDKWTPKVNQLFKMPSTDNLQNNVLGYLADPETGVLDPKIVDAIVVGTFRMISDEHVGMWANNESRMAELFGVDASTTIPQELQQFAQSSGMTRTQMIQRVGQMIVQMAGLETQFTNAEQNAMLRLEGALGSMGVALLADSGLIEELVERGDKVIIEMTVPNDATNKVHQIQSLKSIVVNEGLWPNEEQLRNEGKTQQQIRQEILQAIDRSANLDPREKQALSYATTVDKHFLRSAHRGRDQAEALITKIKRTGKWPSQYTGRQAFQQMLDSLPYDTLTDQEEAFMLEISDDLWTKDKAVPSMDAIEIMLTTKYSRGLFGKIFGKDADRVYPTIDKDEANFTDQLQKKTRTPISETQKRLWDQGAKRPHRVVPWLLDPEKGFLHRMGYANQRYLVRMMGGPDLNKKVHMDNEQGVIDRYDQSVREYKAMESHVVDIMNGNIDQDFFLIPEAYRNGRGGYTSPGLSPQQLKSHRWAMTSREHTYELDATKDSKQRQNMQFSIVAAVDKRVDPNKMTAESAIANFEKLTVTDMPSWLREVLPVMDQILTDPEYVPVGDDPETLAVAVEQTGNGLLGLRGLYELRRYMRAQSPAFPDSNTFTTDLSVSRDGVSDGPMRLILEYGDNAEQTAEALEMGGFYTEDSLYKNYPEFFENTKKDMARSVAISAVNKTAERQDKMRDNIDANPRGYEHYLAQQQLVNAVVGNLKDKDGNLDADVVAALRELAKYPLTKSSYSAGGVKVKDELGDVFFNQLMKMMEKNANDPNPKFDNVHLIERINDVINAQLKNNGLDKDPNLPLSEQPIPITAQDKYFMHYSMSNAQKQHVKSAIMDTFGNELLAAIGEQLDSTRETTAVSNHVDSFMFNMKQAVHNAVKREVLAKRGHDYTKLDDATLLAQELTQAEQNVIDKELGQIDTTVRSIFSKRDKDLANQRIAGTQRSKIGQEFGSNINPVTGKAFTAENSLMHFSASAGQVELNPFTMLQNGSNNQTQQTSLPFEAPINVAKRSGVAGTVIDTHHRDSYNNAMAWAYYSVINGHDGIQTGSPIGRYYCQSHERVSV